jgi:hypothetical protein
MPATTSTCLTPRRPLRIVREPRRTRFDLPDGSCGKQPATRDQARSPVPLSPRRAHRLGRIGLCGFQWRASPQAQGDALADVGTRNRADQSPRKPLQSLLDRGHFPFRSRFRLVACVCLTVSIGRPLPMGAPPIRSSDIPLFSGAIGSLSTAGFVLPRPKRRPH